MIDQLLRDFAEENFGKGYFPVCHGETEGIKMFGLMVKQKRSVLPRPFKKFNYVSLAGMEKFVQKGNEKEFMDATNSHITKEANLVLEADEEDGGGAARSVEVGVEAANCVGTTIAINQELGKLDLGKIDQEHVTDPDLRDILAETELDANKMREYEGQKLGLITSVIYSERFELKGNRKMEIEVGAKINIPNQVLAKLKGHFKKMDIPPKMAKRKKRGPFLLKCARVEFDPETNRLKLLEVVGKDIHRAVDEEDDEEDEEYDDTVVGLENEESDLADSFIDEDSKRLEKIKESVLLPTKDREERKARVNKYLQWFKDALAKDQKRFSLDAPLTDADREFLQAIFVPAAPNQSTVDLSRLSDEKIQGYAIVLKIIADIPDEGWDEVEKAWEESG